MIFGAQHSRRLDPEITPDAFLRTTGIQTGIEEGELIRRSQSWPSGEYGLGNTGDSGGDERIFPCYGSCPIVMQ